MANTRRGMHTGSVRKIFAVWVTVAVSTACACTPGPVSGPANAAAPVAAFLGDSYTWGWGITERSRRWSTLVAHQMGWEERNFGVGGTGYSTYSDKGQAYRYRADEITAVAPNIVVVSGGVNDRRDIASDREAVVEAVEQTYENLREHLPRARIIAVGPTFLDQVTPDLIALDEAVRGAARDVGADYVSLISPTYVLRPDEFNPDGLHVNDEGHRAIADRVVSVLSER
jgi:lysophospholipase L1-like esterase